MGKAAAVPAAADDDIEASIATISAIGEALDRMQARLDEQAALIDRLRKDVGDLTMHKEAAYSEMSKAEAAMRTERARAESAEHACADAARREREAQEKLGRLMASVRDTFGRPERAATA